MTVSSLWAALDEAGCGTPVSISDFNLRGRSRAHGGNGQGEKKQTILAVDLSIWICEGISSTALSTFHSDPALHLVYQRATKLLKLGLGLVFVVEGKQRRAFVPTRTKSSSSSQQIESRRSGSQFWDASKRCESMLQALGVPVVRAETEGEALCALLNSSGLVDGVISNDGDCLLFGAKTVYTNFSLESLENRQVMRYDASKLVFAERNGGDHSTARTTKLSREDLIAFGMICGSDLCGEGVPHCGHKKAIQFLHACRSEKEGQQCHDGRTCLDTLLSWSDIAAAAAGSSAESSDADLDCDDDGPCTIPIRCCSICLHTGDKLQHEKHGCVECGTGPGEGCCVVSSAEKFLRSLKAKAIRGPIAPRHVVDQYLSPNNNHVPSSLRLLLSKPYYVVSPDARSLFTTSMILKGKSKESSLEYIKSTLPKLLARLDLWDTRPRNNYITPASKHKYKPIPLRIEKSVVKLSWPCYELTWSINIGVVEDEQFQFNTFECQLVVDAVLPQLVKTFRQEERRKVQGRAEEERRKHFTGAKFRKNYVSNRNVHLQNQRIGATRNPNAKQQRKKRDRIFDVTRVSKLPKMTAPFSSGLGLDVSLLMDSLPGESLDSDIARISSEDHFENQDEPDDTREVGAVYYDDTEMFTNCTDADIPSWSSCAYRGSNQYCSLDEDLHDILFDDINNDVLGYEDIMSTPMQQVEVIEESEYQLNSSWDDIRTENCRYDGDYLPSRSEQIQRSKYYTLDLRKEKVFCDMGIRVEITPIISRRRLPREECSELV